MVDPNERLRLFAQILSALAYDQDPPSGYFESSLDAVLTEHSMSRNELDALAQEVGIDWACQDKPADPATLCESCGADLKRDCFCEDGAKINDGALFRRKRCFGQCYEKTCLEAAHYDGWCDEHSAQFKRFGTHHPVGPHGSSTP